MESLIGNKSEFAVQVMTEADLTPPSAVWGRMCLWVNNISLGNFNEEHCGLYQCVHHLNEVATSLELLCGDAINNKSDIDAYNFLKSAWLEPNSNDFGEPNEASQYHKYNISYGLAEMFDKEPIFFLINTSNGHLKLLRQSTTNDDISSHIINKKVFTNVIAELNTWYMQQAEVLNSDNA